MKRIVVLFATVAASVVMLAVALAPVSRAVTSEQGQLKPGDTSIYNSISMDCLAVKFKLSKIHQDDGLLRVVLGQQYETTSDKLIARLNTRIVENRLDGAELIKIASEYEQALKQFREDYQKYEISMNSLLKADCQSQQQTYYVSLESTRELRDAVNDDVTHLNSLLAEYHDAFMEFRKAFEADQNKEQNDAAA